MKVAIVGAGAMGSLFGALLAEGGHEVWLCDIWQDHINAVKQNGLKIEREGEARNVTLDAAGDPRQIGESELVLIFVKSTQTKSAAESAAHLAGRNGWVMTLQNGMGNAEIIAEHTYPGGHNVSRRHHDRGGIDPSRRWRPHDRGDVDRR